MSFHTPRLIPEKAVFRPALASCFLPEFTGEHAMATLSFKEQYTHPNWQRKRLEVMEDADFACETCDATDVTLNVHHKRYVKGRMVWDYERSELQCLCEPCHREHHEHRSAIDVELALLESWELPRIHAVLVGMRNGIVPGDGVPPEFVDAHLLKVPEDEFATEHAYIAGQLAAYACEDMHLPEIVDLLSALRHCPTELIVAAAKVAHAAHKQALDDALEKAGL